MHYAFYMIFIYSYKAIKIHLLKNPLQRILERDLIRNKNIILALTIISVLYKIFNCAVEAPHHDNLDIMLSYSFLCDL